MPAILHPQPPDWRTKAPGPKQSGPNSALNEAVKDSNETPTLAKMLPKTSNVKVALVEAKKAPPVARARSALNASVVRSTPSASKTTSIFINVSTEKNTSD